MTYGQGGPVPPQDGRGWPQQPPQGYNGQPGQQQWGQPGQYGQFPPPGQQYPNYYQQPGPPPPQRKKTPAWPFIAGGGCLVIVVIAVVAVLAVAHTAKKVVQAAASAEASASAPVTVTYKVTGSPTDVMYGPAGDMTQRTGPGRATGRVTDPAYVALTAQLQGSGTATCEILVNGKVVSEHTASGGYSIADCEIDRSIVTGRWEDISG